MTKPWLPLALLLVTLMPTAVRSEEGDAAQVFEISRARVLASPGVPRALDPFLPSRAPAERLRWPLPDGPLLVLGLPATDPVARALADVFHLRAAPEDLRGGYGLWAWHDGNRPLVFVLGADATALNAARFEFDHHAPMGAGNPNARSIDFARPNEEAGLVVRAGQRTVRPRYRMRAWAPGGTPPPGFETGAAGTRANRVWLDPLELLNERTATAISALAEHGTTPVIVLRSGFGPPRLHGKTTLEFLSDVARVWQRGAGVRHFALVFDTPLERVRKVGRGYGAQEADLAARLAGALRDGGLDELVVVPRCHSDRLAAALGPTPDLRAIPEASIAWSGPLDHSVEITRAQAERRVREAGVPVVLLDTWATPFQDEAAAATHVPATPYGRAEDLHEALDGVVVVGARHAEANLDAAWEPGGDERFGAALLTPLLPASAPEAGTFLARSAVALERQAHEDHGLVTWMRPLAASLRAAAKRIEAGAPTLAVPVVPAGVTLDGRIDEPSWGFAHAVPLEKPGVDVLLLSDGRHLHVALRARKGAAPKEKYLPLVAIDLAVPESGSSWSLGLQCEGVDISGQTRRLGREPWSHVKSAFRVGEDRYVAEIRLDRFALFGEALPTRRFEFAVTWGNERLWPPPTSPAEAGLLVVTR